jgi:hypothetical protein
MPSGVAEILKQGIIYQQNARISLFQWTSRRHLYCCEQKWSARKISQQKSNITVTLMNPSNAGMSCDAFKLRPTALLLDGCSDERLQRF